MEAFVARPSRFVFSLDGGRWPPLPCLTCLITKPRGTRTFTPRRVAEVLQAREGTDDESGRTALANLCACYWHPLYTYVRRKGKQPADAEDLTQGFLMQMLEKRWLDRVDRSKGKFRTFLLTCFDRDLYGEHDKVTARKRGGDCDILSVDWNEAESKLALNSREERSPEEAFDLAWATEILRRTLERLQEHYSETGKARLYKALSPLLVGEAEYGQLAKVASRLEMEPGAVRVASTRMRQKYRELLLVEVSQTVIDDDAAREEYRQIGEILRRA